MLFTLITTYEVMDYTNEPYILVPSGDAYLFVKRETIYHLFNISLFQEKYDKYMRMSYHPKNRKMVMLAQRCKEYLDQLTDHRNRRSLDFLGTGIKFITGTPDHDDLVTVESKLNQLVKNNNNLAIINSRLLHQLENISPVFGRENALVLFEWLAMELTEIINTINLAKLGVLNTKVLNFSEMRRIIRDEIGHEMHIPLIEILEHATFSILESNSIYVLLIKYPRVQFGGKLYAIRAVANRTGKLELEKFAVENDRKYHTVSACKRFINANVCSYREHTCTEELLNGMVTNCNLIKEKMLDIEEFDEGKIVINGNHTINGLTRTGVFMIMFNGTVVIDGTNYTNERNNIREFLRLNRPAHYEVMDIIESENEKMKIPELTIISQIPLELEEHPIRSLFIIIVAIIIFIIVTNVAIKIYKIYLEHQKRKIEMETNNYVRALFNTNTNSVSVHTT